MYEGDEKKLCDDLIAQYRKFSDTFGKPDEEKPSGYQFAFRFIDKINVSAEMRMAVADWTSCRAMTEDDRIELRDILRSDYEYLAQTNPKPVLNKSRVDFGCTLDCRDFSCPSNRYRDGPSVCGRYHIRGELRCPNYHVRTNTGRRGCEYTVYKELELRMHDLPPDASGRPYNFPTNLLYSAQKRHLRAFVVAPSDVHYDNLAAAENPEFWAAVLKTAFEFSRLLGVGEDNIHEVFEKIMINFGGWDLVGCGNRGHAHAHLALTPYAAEIIDDMDDEEHNGALIALQGRGDPADYELLNEWQLADRWLHFDLYPKMACVKADIKDLRVDNAKLREEMKGIRESLNSIDRSLLTLTRGGIPNPDDDPDSVRVYAQ